MSEDDYIKCVLQKYQVQTGPGSPGYVTAQELYPLVKRWGGDYLVNVSFSGSYAKGTAVKCATDVDLFISLSPNTPGSLEDVYKSLLKSFSGNGFSPRSQNVSVGITHKGVSVDLVPGRQQSAYTSDHSLYRRKANSWTKTNVETHVSTVQGCGRLDEIRALKIWRTLQSLEFPSFYLELTVMNALSGRQRGRLAANVAAVLEYVAGNLISARVIDPANTNNLISDDLSYSEKQLVAQRAWAALQSTTWAEVLY